MARVLKKLQHKELTPITLNFQKSSQGGVHPSHNTPVGKDLSFVVENPRTLCLQLLNIALTLEARGPERIGSTLKRSYRVNAATIFFQKKT